MSELEEWQPCLLVPNVHPKRIKFGKTAKWINPVPKRPVYARILPTKLRKENECGASEFYAVHPDDVARITGTDENYGREIIVCEHHVLTD